MNEHKEKLTELNKASLTKLDEYLSTQADLKEEHQEQVKKAKDDWQYAWNQLMESLLVLEKLEI